MNPHDQQYGQLLQTILDKGIRQPNRTGIDTIGIFGAMMRFEFGVTAWRDSPPLVDGSVEKECEFYNFPVLTTKRMAFKSILGELLCFLQGKTNVKDYQAYGCKVWDANAADPKWLANENFNGVEGDLGRNYAAQWRSYTGWNEKMGPHNRDQISALLHQIRTDPTSRRLILNSWNPTEIHYTALPPCHIMAQFYINQETREMSMSMYQRSCDMFLGVAYNITSYALLLCTIASLTGYKPKEFVHFLGDAHIYVNHIDQVKEQLSRDTFPSPSLRIWPDDIDDLRPTNFDLIGYNSHMPIKAEMAL